MAGCDWPMVYVEITNNELGIDWKQELLAM